MEKNALTLLEEAGIKATPNRLLVVKALINSEYPLSLVEIENQLETVEKSSVFRVLTLFVEKDLVHTLEDGRGIVKYELCGGHDRHSASDMHAHFYCEKCQRVFCLENINASAAGIPPEYLIKSVNFMLKGICPECRDN
ncbi:MAG: transcriptional repressor [Duncaniella sp.]|nr:transcriptional repressor [Duncaniella sp.]